MSNVAEKVEEKGELGELPPSKAHEVIVNGVPVRFLHSFVTRLDLTQNEASRVLDVGVRTYQRIFRNRRSRLTTAVGGRLYRADSIARRAAEVFGSDDDAKSWLRSEQRALGFKKPLDMMSTEAGAVAVERLLGRIEYGVIT